MRILEIVVGGPDLERQLERLLGVRLGPAKNTDEDTARNLPGPAIAHNIVAVALLLLDPDLPPEMHLVQPGHHRRDPVEPDPPEQNRIGLQVDQKGRLQTNQLNNTHRGEIQGLNDIQQ